MPRPSESELIQRGGTWQTRQDFWRGGLRKLKWGFEGPKFISAAEGIEVASMQYEGDQTAVGTTRTLTLNPAVQLDALPETPIHCSNGHDHVGCLGFLWGDQDDPQQR